MTIVAFAPNWLGDAVMALPAVADLARRARRDGGDGRLIVAARRGVATLFACVAGVDEVVTLGAGGRLAAAQLAHDARVVRATRAQCAVLFPNSVRSALAARLAGVPERSGYRGALRGPLLTRAVERPPRPRHQVDYYRALVAALGVENGTREPALDVPDSLIAGARALLQASGWDGVRPLVGLAPGAAYGTAKRWPAGRFARVVGRLVRERGASCVLLGGPGEADVARTIVDETAKMSGPDARGAVIDLAGRTSLGEAAAIMAACAVFVTNDSGAMHLAAAVGTPVVAIFGPTDARETAPLPRAGGRAVVLAGEAFCRPCGLRECPIDHRCMTSVPVDRVVQAVGEVL